MKRLFNCIIVLFYIYVNTATAYETATKAAIASAHPLATEAGFEILNQGGNAFDAAIAVSAALAVVEPAGSGLGGGGFWLLHRAADNYQVMIDGRETAPGAAHRDLYLAQDGNVNKQLVLDGPLAAAIPGVPAALAHINKKYGRLSLQQNLAPAIRYAKTGFKVTPHYQNLAKFRSKALKLSAEAQDTFLIDGAAPAIDSIIEQHNLAQTLEQLAQYGHDGFYRGEIADKLVQGVQQAGGIWTLQDLYNYQIKERTPISGSYQGYNITSAALPSSGGTVLLSMLNQLEHLDIRNISQDQTRHLIVETMRRAYFDRSRYLGDSDFITIPDHLTNKTYAKQLVSSINLNHASDSETLAVNELKGEDTTHFSIVDQYGNRVAATLSINYPFGSGFIPAGTGVLLNDEMDDFSAQVGAANVYGLVGNKANAIVANKRPLSSMSPTFIENDQKLMVIGTPGGSRIITMVLLAILDFIDNNSADQIVAAPRFHHQYLPNQVQMESIGFTNKDRQGLQHYGHDIKNLDRQYGNMQLIIQHKNSRQLTAASDPRGQGLADVRPITP